MRTPGIPHYLSFFIICIFFLPLTFAQQTSFEGTIATETPSDFEGVIHVAFGSDEPHENSPGIDYYAKDGMVVADVLEEGAGALLMKGDKMYVISTYDETYMEFPIDGGPDAEPGPEVPDNAVTKTGETKEIHGCTAERWEMDFMGIKGDIWATKDLCAFYDVEEYRWQSPFEKIFAGGWFPLIIKDMNTALWEVTSIERKELGEHEFQVPPGYQEVEQSSY